MLKFKSKGIEAFCEKDAYQKNGILEVQSTHTQLFK